MTGGTRMPVTNHYSWHSGLNTAADAVFTAFAAKPAAPANVKRSPQRLGEALR